MSSPATSFVYSKPPSLDPISRPYILIPLGTHVEMYICELTYIWPFALFVALRSL